MDNNCHIAVLGTFDSKAEEHIFLKQRIERRGFQVMTINVGTGAASPIKVDLDLFESVSANGNRMFEDRDTAINAMLDEAKILINRLHQEGKISGNEVFFVEMLNYQGQEMRVTYTGTISGDEIKFTRNVADMATEELVAKRAK